MSERLVNCIKLGAKLPGLDSPPLPGELGQRIFENVSKDAWKEFLEHFKMVINEYRLDLTSPMADQIFEQKADEYFFSDNFRMPEGYVPEN
ncbi:MAG: oxidative damage protection protein [Ignavibacteria bacterium]|nr:oxidative damage protection protein [Ignavibacteria bacterium]